mmetsp:Transcript_8326/g.29571  ORF Transcript_8326/g.29571 Transcript_8326/m.29571 type:complete len:385 (-) Transcript_8326:994-2148(-)
MSVSSSRTARATGPSPWRRHRVCPGCDIIAHKSPDVEHTRQPCRRPRASLEAHEVEAVARVLPQRVRQLRRVSPHVVHTGVRPAPPRALALGEKELRDHTRRVRVLLDLLKGQHVGTVVPTRVGEGVGEAQLQQLRAVLEYAPLLGDDLVKDAAARIHHAQEPEPRRLDEVPAQRHAGAAALLHPGEDHHRRRRRRRPRARRQTAVHSHSRTRARAGIQHGVTADWRRARAVGDGDVQAEVRHHHHDLAVVARAVRDGQLRDEAVLAVAHGEDVAAALQPARDQALEQDGRARRQLKEATHARCGAVAARPRRRQRAVLRLVGGCDHRRDQEVEATVRRRAGRVTRSGAAAGARAAFVSAVRASGARRGARACGADGRGLAVRG